MKKQFILISMLILMGALSKLSAQDFVYTPINPAFGGNYMNYSWLLSSANAQNTIEDDKAKSSSYSNKPYDPMSDFQSDLERRFFSELSKKITDSYFGEGDGSSLENGSYNFGDYQIEIYEDLKGVNVKIYNASDGSTSTLTLPYY